MSAPSYLPDPLAPALQPQLPVGHSRKDEREQVRFCEDERRLLDRVKLVDN